MAQQLRLQHEYIKTMYTVIHKICGRIFVIITLEKLV